MNSTRNKSLTPVFVTKVGSDYLEFSDGTWLNSTHSQDCCESHYLSFEDITLSDFDDLEFDLSSDTFFRRIKGYGIELIPKFGHSVRVPGYGYNNGYYSDNLQLHIENIQTKVSKHFDISECQVVSD